MQCLLRAFADNLIINIKAVEAESTIDFPPQQSVPCRASHGRGIF